MSFEDLFMSYARLLDQRGEWVKANWIRSQIQEFAAELRRIWGLA